MSSKSHIPLAKHILWLPVAIWLTKTLVLGFENELGSYIHPRFNTFTIAFSALGLGLMIVALLQHGRSIMQATPQWLSWVVFLGSAGLALVPPLTLSAASVISRASEASYAASTTRLHARYDQFTVKDWSSLLAQTPDPISLVGKPVAFEAFVSRPASTAAPALLSRFSVTCCAVDAQPISLPARSTELESLSANQWVKITGVWARDPTSSTGISITVHTLDTIAQPKEPYVY